MLVVLLPRHLRIIVDLLFMSDYQQEDMTAMGEKWW